MFGRWKAKPAKTALAAGDSRQDGVFFISGKDENAESVLAAIQARKIPISTSCGGMGSCGTCRVFVVKGAELLNERTEIEIELGEARGFKENERLACQLRPCEGVVLEIPPVADSED